MSVCVYVCGCVGVWVCPLVKAIGTFFAVTGPRPVAGGGVLEAVAHWRSLAGGASYHSISPKNIYIYICIHIYIYTHAHNRSKMRHALPWLSLVGGEF